MNLEGFVASTPLREYKRVVRHETGHTLGCEHEHMRREIVERIDHEKAYAYFKKYDNWSRKDVDLQVLTPIEEVSLIGTMANAPCHPAQCVRTTLRIVADAGSTDSSCRASAVAG
jgi:hypothetical protein